MVCAAGPGFQRMWHMSVFKSRWTRGGQLGQRQTEESREVLRAGHLGQKWALIYAMGK